MSLLLGAAGKKRGGGTDYRDNLIVDLDCGAGSGTSILDVSGNGNHCALSGGYGWTADGVQFDGGTAYGYISRSASLDALKDKTIIAVVTLETFGQPVNLDRFGRICAAESTASNTFIDMYTTSRSDWGGEGALTWSGPNSVGQSKIETPQGSVYLGVRQSLYGTDEDTVGQQAFVENTLEASGTHALPMGTFSQGLYVGDRAALDRAMDGVLHHFRIYTTVLTQEQLNQVYGVTK